MEIINASFNIKVVKEFTLAINNQIQVLDIPQGSRFLCAFVDGSILRMSMEVDDFAPTQQARFVLISNGMVLPNNRTYLSSIKFPSHVYWHLYEYTQIDKEVAE